MTAENPALLVEHDLLWIPRAAHHLTEIRAALVGVPGVADAKFDHIGSTSVPGLAAKPFLDLQIRILPLPAATELSARLVPLGFQRAQGARPDSPGVDRDIPRGDEKVPDEVWEKRLYVAPERSVILHVRRIDSPWGAATPCGSGTGCTLILLNARSTREVSANCPPRTLASRTTTTTRERRRASSIGSSRRSLNGRAAGSVKVLADYLRTNAPAADLSAAVTCQLNWPFIRRADRI